jgi:cytochrome c oxidase cbb3-type subunit 1
LFALFGGAAVWLALSSVLGLIASIKFHSPNFLADYAWLTYGRVHPASTNALVFGFAIPAGLGVALWLLARFGRVTLARPWLIFVGAKLWHVGVLVGLLGILGGDATGFEWLEMPRYAAVILFVAFLLIALWGFVTHSTRSRRREETDSSVGGEVRLVTSAATNGLYPSQWFVLAALFWFPWIYSTANLLLLVFPVRGVTQAAIQWWFSGNLLIVWLSLVGLAASFYFLPKLSERPLQSHYLALFVFWTLILFGTWVGIPGGATLPAWMPAVSGNATLLMLVPVLAVGTITMQTLRRDKWQVTGYKNRAQESCHLSPVTCHPRGGPLCYVRFGVGSFVLSGLLLAASALPQVSRVTDFTWFGTAQTQLRLYGFFAMTMFGAAYHILPRVTGSGFPFAKLVRIHFFCGVFGTLLLTLPLAVGGVIQGLKLANPTITFVDLTKSTLMFLRVSTLGDTLLLLGNLLFLLNVTVLIARYYRAVCKTAYASATAQLEPTPYPSQEGNAEVKP